MTSPPLSGRLADQEPGRQETAVKSLGRNGRAEPVIPGWEVSDLSVCFESFAIVIGKMKVVYILIPQTVNMLPPVENGALQVY